MIALVLAFFNDNKGFTAAIATLTWVTPAAIFMICIGTYHWICNLLVLVPVMFLGASFIGRILQKMHWVSYNQLDVIYRSSQKKKDNIIIHSKIIIIWMKDDISITLRCIIQIHVGDTSVIKYIMAVKFHPFQRMPIGTTYTMCGCQNSMGWDEWSSTAIKLWEPLGPLPRVTR